MVRYACTGTQVRTYATQLQVTGRERREQDYSGPAAPLALLHLLYECGWWSDMLEWRAREGYMVARIALALVKVGTERVGDEDRVGNMPLFLLVRHE